jgi:hypothetical protein
MTPELIGDLLDAVSPTQVGRSILLPPTRQEETVIRLSGPDTRTQMLTATITRGAVAVPAAGEVNVVAIARWGAGGAQQIVTMDVVNGTTISVPGSYLEIAARNDGTIPIQVSATAGYGARASHGLAPTFTVEREFSAAGSDTVEIPNFAVQVAVLFPSGAPAVNAEVLSATGTVLHGATGILSGDIFLLPSRAFSVRLTVGLPPLPPLLVQVVFSLAL